MSGSVVIGPEFIFITLFAFAVVATSIVDMGRRRVWDEARWALAGMILLGVLGLLVQIPDVYHGFDDAVGVPDLAVLVNFCAYIATGGVVHLWISTWPSTTLTVVRGTPRKRTIALVVIGGAVVLSLLFAAGVHPHEEPAEYFLAYAHDLARRAMVLLYAGIYGGLWAWAGVRVRRVRIASSAGGMRWLGSGLALLEVAVALTVLYAVVVCASTVTRAGGAPWMLIADCVTVTAATLGCIAFSCRVWGPQLERLFGGPSENQTARMQYRQLRVLHRLVGSGAPVRMRRGLGLRRRDPKMALAYQVCAIIEGRKQLAGYRDERVEAEAAAWGQALAQAVRLAAAAQRHWTPGPVTPAREASPVPDLGAELDRDLRLASALTMLQTLHNTGEYERFATPGATTSHPAPESKATVHYSVQKI